ncbi:MAG TPA: hypothetical protein PKD72_13880, partial [Gemmatales bacterium]|nr:hypothetical protein [Gemmatales bacterium]
QISHNNKHLEGHYLAFLVTGLRYYAVPSDIAVSPLPGLQQLCHAMDGANALVSDKPEWPHISPDFTFLLTYSY